MNNIKKIILFLAATLMVTGILADNQPQEQDVFVETQRMKPTVWLGGDYSDFYGFVALSQFANYISPSSAVAFLLDFGAKQFRMDVTWAQAIADNQRFKVSAQHMSQDNDYIYATGEDHAFVGQTAVGAEYEYITQRKFPHAYHITGYYFTANDRDFDDTTFTTTKGTFIDHRSITGGQGGGVHIGPRLKPWSGADLKLGFGYDQVNYNMQTEPNKNQSGFGSNIYFTQQLSEALMFEASMEHRAPYQQYAAGFTWTAFQNAQKGSQLGLKLEGRHVSSDALPASSESIIGLSLVYQWDGNAVFSDTSQCEQTETSCGLLDWSSKSVARLPSVFVLRDETISMK